MNTDRPLITSRANPLVKQVRALAQSKYREQHEQFLVEGIQLVLQALESGAQVQLLIVAPDLLTSERALQAVMSQEHSGMRIVKVSSEVFESLAEREHPTGIAAVVRIAPRTLSDLRVDENALFVALFRVGNPGNLGSILRTADAVKARGVILIGEATDPYAPAVIKASRGAVFSVPFVKLDDTQELMDWCSVAKVRMVSTSDTRGKTLWESNLDAPLMLLFGNEGEGLPPELLATGETVRIPMAGAVDSLNLAVAAGVLLYECVRRKI